MSSFLVIDERLIHTLSRAVKQHQAARSVVVFIELQTTWHNPIHQTRFDMHHGKSNVFIKQTTTEPSRVITNMATQKAVPLIESLRMNTKFSKHDSVQKQAAIQQPVEEEASNASYIQRTKPLSSGSSLARPIGLDYPVSQGPQIDEDGIIDHIRI